MVDPQGKAHDVPLAEIPRAQSLGFKPESDDAARARLKTELTEEQWSSPAGKLTAGTFGALRGATLGGSDVLIGAVGGSSALREAKEANPGLSLGTEIVGAIATLGTSLPAGLAAKAGARVAATEAGASTLAKIGRGFAGGATEGGIQGLGTGVSELALSKEDLTFEHAASVLGSNALFGAATGGAVGGVAKGAEIGLGKAKNAIDDFVSRRSVAADVPADVAGLDAKGLRVAEADELAAIEAGRVPQRAQVADEIRAHRQALKDEKVWLATNGAKERELKEIGKISFDADRQLDRLLNNPKALAQKPQRALDALQQQEHALEQLAAADGHIRSTLAAADELDLNKLTAAERDAVDVYTGGEYRVVNAHLRGQKHWGEIVGPEYEMTRGTVGEAVRNLDSMLGRAPQLAEPTTVYRGVLPRSKPYKVGETITDKGFQSTSLNRQTAEGFAQGLDGKGRVFEIELPAGTRALDATKVMGGAEAELLLARGAKMQITEVTDDLIRARLKLPKGKASKAGVASGSTRAAALDAVPAALERNRALQARIGELVATPKSARLESIAAAKDALSTGGGKTIGEQMAQGAAYSATAGVVGAIPFVGPFLAPIVGAKASKLVEGGFGKLGKATSAAATRGAKAASAFLGVAEKGVKKAAPVAVPVATKVLAALRFAPPKPGEKPAPTKAAKLHEVFTARAAEVRSQTMYDVTGRAVMRPEARMALGDSLKAIGAVNPILADRIETIRARAIEVLANALPRRPDLPGAQLGGPDRWQHSDMEMRAWARLAHAIEDPAGALERAAAGMTTPEDAKAMQQVYPEMLADFVQKVTAQASTMEKPLPYARRLALSVLTGQALDPAMDPRILKTLQASFTAEPGTDGGSQAPRAQPNFSALGSVSRRAEQEQTPSQRRQA